MATETGTIAALWRYPIKSMLGEELQAAEITEYGVLGDRTYALIDSAEGKTASAKNPNKWPTMFEFRAAFLESPKKGAILPAVRVTLPNGSTLSSKEHDFDHTLSQALNRSVSLAWTERGKVTGVHATLPATWAGKSEEYRLDMEGVEQRGHVKEFTLPTGTFFDGAIIHVLTTATLDQLHDAYPQGQFAPQRFRPNIVIRTPDDAKGFVEHTWIGRQMSIGDVKLKFTGPCGRCVMTTLAQEELPKDIGILRTAMKQNEGQVGVYAIVLQGGTIRRGDQVKLS
jgi:uncharacterized protein YcbX